MSDIMDCQKLSFEQLNVDAKQTAIDEILDGDCYFDDTDWYAPVKESFAHDIQHLGFYDVEFDECDMQLGGHGVSRFEAKWRGDLLQLNLLKQQAPHIFKLCGLNTQKTASKVLFTKSGKYDAIIEKLGGYLYEQLMERYNYLRSDEAVAVYLTDNSDIKFHKDGTLA